MDTGSAHRNLGTSILVLGSVQVCTCTHGPRRRPAGRRLPPGPLHRCCRKRGLLLQPRLPQPGRLPACAREHATPPLHPPTPLRPPRAAHCPPLAPQQGRRAPLGLGAGSPLDRARCDRVRDCQRLLRHHRVWEPGHLGVGHLHRNPGGDHRGRSVAGDVSACRRLLRLLVPGFGALAGFWPGGWVGWGGSYWQSTGLGVGRVRVAPTALAQLRSSGRRRPAAQLRPLPPDACSALLPRRTAPSTVADTRRSTRTRRAG
jgi:hypothetical protein